MGYDSINATLVGRIPTTRCPLNRFLSSARIPSSFSSGSRPRLSASPRDSAAFARTFNDHPATRSGLVGSGRARRASLDAAHATSGRPQARASTLGAPQVSPRRNRRGWKTKGTRAARDSRRIRDRDGTGRTWIAAGKARCRARHGAPVSRATGPSCDATKKPKEPKSRRDPGEFMDHDGTDEPGARRRRRSWCRPACRRVERLTDAACPRWRRSPRSRRDGQRGARSWPR
jgi:hypothetical protein